jgi:hypothetical protein
VKDTWKPTLSRPLHPGRRGGQFSIVRRNLCHDIDYGNTNIHARGVFFEKNSKDNTIENNLIYRVAGAGILDGSLPTNPVRRNKYYNNTIYDINVHGIRLSNSHDAEIKNNIIMNADTAEITTTAITVSNGGNVFSNKLYFNSERSNIGVWNNNTDIVTANLNLASWNSASGETGSVGTKSIIY